MKTHIQKIAVGLMVSVSTLEAATFTVTNAADSGVGTLRAAITNANNAGAGSHIIAFNLAAPYRITLTNSLPAVTNTALIDGVTQPGYTGAPIVQLKGQGNFGFGPVLQFYCRNGGVQGLRIEGFSGNGSVGVQLDGLSNRLAGCWIMTNYVGVIVGSWGSGAQIGGTSASNRNIIAANLDTAVNLVGLGGGNIVRGNHVGIYPSGAVASNGMFGIMISTPSNVVGGSSASERNVIAGFSHSGIFVLSTNSVGSQISGNYIGTDATGTNALPTGTGINLSFCRSVIVGGGTPAHGNVICGNTGVGLRIDGTNSTLHLIQNNRIGIDANGNALPNGMAGNLNGVVVNSHSNSILFNVISGNKGHGVQVQGRGNTFAGNLIGLDPTGAAAVPNSYAGIYLDSGAAANSIGSLLFRNVISGNGTIGIQINAPDATNNVIAGNYIGTDVTGKLPVGNLSDGISISAAAGTVVGNNTAGGNVISANGQDGVNIIGLYANQVSVDFNLIGTDATGTNAMGNAAAGIVLNGGSGHRIGASGRNVICANGTSGISVGSGVTNLIIAGNYIGVATNGTRALGNQLGINLNLVAGQGLLISNNVVSGNVQDGMTINDCAVSNLAIVGNTIGLAANGTNAVANGDRGIAVAISRGVRIGGTNVAERNIVSGNAGHGIHIHTVSNNAAVVIAGNYIGLNAAGAAAGNGGYGVLGTGVHGVQVGGPTPAWRNLIGGNDVGIGIQLGCASWWVANNALGVDPVGLVTRSNRSHGVHCYNGAASNLIENNIIANSGGDGVRLDNATSGTVVRANRIGMGALTFVPMPNLGAGIQIVNSSDNLCGGLGTGDANRIAFNLGAGIGVVRTSPNQPGVNNRLLGNLIYSNGTTGIDLGLDGATPNDAAPDADTGPNEYQNFPTLHYAAHGGTNISGKFIGAPGTKRLEFFALTPGAGMMFIGAADHHTPATGTGSFSYVFNAAVPTGSLIVATATSDDGTSEFSAPLSTTGLADTDGDGMPDWWEIVNGLNPAVPNDPMDDADGDGVPDLEEWIADTTANDPDSFLSILDLHIHPAARSIYVWSSSERLYALEGADSPASPWTLLQDFVPGTGGLLALGDTLPANLKCYRVKVKMN